MSNSDTENPGLETGSEAATASGDLVRCAVSPRPSVKLGHYTATLPTMLARSEEILALSARERQTLVLFAQGFSGPEVAEQLGISRNTIDTYRRRIFVKTGAKTMAEAVALFAAQLLGAKLEQA